MSISKALLKASGFKHRFPNKIVFKTAVRQVSLKSIGRLFQTRGPAALNAPSPKSVRVPLTRSVRVSTEWNNLGRAFSLFTDVRPV